MKERNNDVDGKAFTNLLEDIANCLPEISRPYQVLHISRTMKSHRHEHPEWFQGYAPGGIDEVHEYFNTKEEYFIIKLWNRREGYWKRFQEKLKKNENQRLSLIIQTFVEEFKQLIFDENERKIHNGYFDRKSSTKLCDESGQFSCFPYDGRKCDQHVINPYANKQQRFLFRQWQLDHRYLLLMNQ